jgi:hypothetical protein
MKENEEIISTILDILLNDEEYADEWIFEAEKSLKEGILTDSAKAIAQEVIARYNRVTRMNDLRASVLQWPKLTEIKFYNKN